MQGADKQAEAVLFNVRFGYCYANDMFCRKKGEVWFMKSWRQMLAFILAAVLTFGTLEISAIASEDVGADDGYDETAGETVLEGPAAGDEAVDLAVLLDANGGYFPDAWDDELNVAVEKAEQLHRLIPAGGAVDVFPVLETEGRYARFLGWSLAPGEELVSQEYEEYVPLQSCTLYAVWDLEDDTERSGSDNAIEEESGSQDPQQMQGEEQKGQEEADSSSETFFDTVTAGENGDGDEYDPAAADQNQENVQEEGGREENQESDQGSDQELDPSSRETDGGAAQNEEGQSGEDAEAALESDESGDNSDRESDDENGENDGQGEGSEQGATLNDAETAAPDADLSDSENPDLTESDQENTNPSESDPSGSDQENTDPSQSDPSGSDQENSGPAESDSENPDLAESDQEKQVSEDGDSGKESENGKAEEGITEEGKDSETDPEIVTQEEEETVSDEAMAFASRETLKTGRSTVSISAGETGYFAFIPVYSGQYEFTSKSDQDTYGYLYDSSQNQLACDDDGGEERNFNIKYSLTAGTTYYLGVRFYSSTTSGSVPVIIASCGMQGINSVSVLGGETAYFSLTPSVSGSYVIFSGSSMDTYGYLYDSSWTQLDCNDDSGNGLNFRISSNLSAGSTYYVAAKFFSSSKQGEIKVAAAPVCGGNQYDNYSSDGKFVYFAFIPSVTGEYEFYSKGSEDTVGFLYGPGLDLLSQNDDGGIGRNFCAEGSLQAGNTYLVGARYYQTTSYGQISVYARQCAGSCGSSLTWRLGAWKSDQYNRALTISGTGDMWDYNSSGSNQPWRQDRKFIDEIVIESGVKSVGKGAFKDLTKLNKVSLPSSLTSIGASAFQNCSGLKSIKILKSVTSIGSNAFAGCSSLTISGYKGSKAQSYAKENSIPFRALDKISLSGAKLTVKSPTYTGKLLKPLPVVKLGNTTLARDKDYQVSYKNNKNVGKATLTVKGIGRYTGSKSINFTIKRRSVKSAKVTVPAVAYYGGIARKPAPTVKVGSVTLKRGTDYTVSYKNNKNVGKATATITGKNNYSGSVSATFTIKRRSVKSTKVTVPAITYYGGKARKPVPVVKVGSVTLKRGTDYTVSYKNNKNAGKATAIITGKKNYYGSVSVKFTIRRRSVKKAKVTVSALTYNGKARRPAPRVKVGSVTLKKGTDYTVSYKNNTNAGKATVTITGKKNYYGSVSVKFTIKRRSIQKAKVTVSALTYNGKVRKPAPKVKLGSLTLKKGRDYTVSYKNNKNAGKATVTITGKKNYAGKIITKFTIRKAAPKLAFSKKAITKERSSKAFKNKLTSTTDGRVTFSSSNKRVATVNSAGLVTLKGKGVTTITVNAAAGKNYKAGKASYKLTVLKAGVFQFSRDNWKFTNSSTYFGYGRYIEQISSSYLTRLKNNLKNTEYQNVFSPYNGLIYYYWNGSCYGMAVTEYLAKKKMLPYGKYQSGATKLYQLNAPVENNNVSSLITYYHMLQCKDIMQQAFYKYKNRSEKQNIKSLISILDKNSTAVVCYGEDNWGGHAVLATDYSYGSYNWFGETYQGCIKICDPNYSSSYNNWANIYFNTKTYKWIIPAYYYSFGTRGKIDYVGANISELNKGGYLSGNYSNTGTAYVARLNTYALEDDHNVSKVRKEGGSYVSFDAGSGDIERAESYIMNGGRGTTPGYNLYDSSSSYRVTQSRAASVDLSLKYEDSYLEAMSGAGMSTLFDRSGYVEIKGSPANCRLAATFDGDYPTDWFTVVISGNCGKTISLRKTKQGYVVSGDKLNNIKVTANNKKETVSRTFSTSAGEACICQKSGGGMDIRIDADHDGTFEKSIVK